MADPQFDQLLYQLRIGQTPAFLVRSPRGTWEFSMHQPPLASGAYIERMSNGVIRKWHNSTTSDIEYTDL